MKSCCPYIIKKVEVQPDNDSDIDPIADRDAGYRDFDCDTGYRDPVLNESQPLLPTY